MFLMENFLKLFMEISETLVLEVSNPIKNRFSNQNPLRLLRQLRNSILKLMYQNFISSNFKKKN